MLIAALLLYKSLFQTNVYPTEFEDDDDVSSVVIGNVDTGVLSSSHDERRYVEAEVEVEDVVVAVDAEAVTEGDSGMT